jgi:DNA-binding response OmpR family regulator
MGSRIKTAMIIDDDVDLTNILGTMLEKRKMQVMKIHSLEEAVDYLTYLKPNVIFLDNSFPEGLGVNFISEIRKADSDIKIIMMTADAAAWIEKKAIEQGVDGFLKKPFNTQLIEKALDKLSPGLSD